MDIPVSRLNLRMALQLPAELPLGLVFVVGTVDGFKPDDDSNIFRYFFLAESTYRVRCLLSDRAAIETKFKNGDKIRAGGHLAFDPLKADYYLLARDIEVLTEAEPKQPTGSAIIADIDRRSQETGLEPAELPIWVKQLAPPELMAELGISGPVEAEESPEAVEEAQQETQEDTYGYDLGDDETMLTMSDELIEFLSKAMDSSEEVELTPEVIAHLGVPRDPEVVLATALAANESPEETDVDSLGEASEPSEGADDGLADATHGENVETRDGILETGFAESDSGNGTPENADSGSQPAEFLARDLGIDDELIKETGKSSSSAWPEIAVVVLILVALFLSFAVVYVVAAR